MIESTSKFQVVDIIYNDEHNGFAIAKGHWNGDNKCFRIACRWYANGIGYPQTFGKPQWMMLPDGICVDILNSLDPTKSKVKITFD